MKAAIRGTEIYFDVAGMQLPLQRENIVERPVLFLLHGGPGGDHLRFKQYSLELQDVAQLIFIDQRGCGRSKKTKPEEYTLENNIEDVEALRQYLGLEQICVLGTSYGGMVAQGYAIRYPNHLEKLVLVATAPSYHFIQRAKENLLKQGTPEQIAMAEHLWDGNFENADQVKAFLNLMEPIYSTLAQTHKLPKSKTSWSVEALNQGFKGFLRHFDFIPQLKKIICPTLILAGGRDWISSPDQAKIIAENIPNAQLRIFENSGHSIAIDVHAQYIQIIKDFLAR